MKRLFCIFLTIVLVGCTTGNVRKKLNDIETYISDRPDSALTAIRSIDHSTLTTKSLRAHHALLHAMALDKNYIDVTDDSLARVAVDYYSKRGSKKYKARSLYYLGLAYYYQGEYSKAILEFTKAEEVAQRADSLYLGFSMIAQADVYNKTHNDVQELKYLESAYDIYNQISADYYINVAKLRLAQAYINIGKTDKGLKSIQELIDSPYKRIRILALNSYAFAKATDVDNYDPIKADEVYRKIYNEYGNSHISTKDYWAWSYTLNEIDKKDESVYLREVLDKNDTSLYSSYWKYRIFKSDGETGKALKYLEEYNSEYIEAISSALRQSLATTQKNYYESQYELARLKIRNHTQIFIILTALVLLIVISAAWYVSRRIHQYNDEKENNLKYAEDIKRQLEEAKKGDYPELKRKYISLYKSKFEVIGALYEQYSMSFEKKNAEKVVYRQVAEILNDFKKDLEDRHQLESILNDGLDDIMTKLRSEMPDLKEKYYSVFCLIAMGFDITTISYLLDITTNAVYIRKSRLIQSIEAENPLHKAQFMELLA